MSTQHQTRPTIYTPWHPQGDAPSPWSVEDSDTRCVVLDACGGLVADCTNGFDGDDGWVMSAAVGPLANLLGAAPDLLAVAIRAKAWIEGAMVEMYGYSEERVQAPAGSHLHALNAAIAKANGSQA
jgi:hypothetical protein